MTWFNQQVYHENEVKALITNNCAEINARYTSSNCPAIVNAFKPGTQVKIGLIYMGEFRQILGTIVQITGVAVLDSEARVAVLIAPQFYTMLHITDINSLSLFKQLEGENNGLA